MGIVRESQDNASMKGNGARKRRHCHWLLGTRDDGFRRRLPEHPPIGPLASFSRPDVALHGEEQLCPVAGVGSAPLLTLRKKRVGCATEQGTPDRSRPPPRMGAQGSRPPPREQHAYRSDASWDLHHRHPAAATDTGLL